MPRIQVNNHALLCRTTPKHTSQYGTCTVKNLAHLKRLLQPGAQYRTLRHDVHPDYVGLTRVVSTVQKNAVYSRIKDQPEHKLSACNYGKGVRTDFEKASCYRFGDTVEVLDERGRFMYEFEVLDNE